MSQLTSLPLSHRPRERLFRQGTHSLSLEDLLAVLIGSGRPGQDVLALAGQVTVRLLAGATAEELLAVPGLGRGKSARVAAALALDAALRQRLPLPALSDAAAVAAACSDFADSNQEQLVVFYVNSRSQRLARETVSIGTATASLAHPREVFRPAIAHNASAVVLAHNHPSGDPTPSAADREVTRLMAEAGRVLGIGLVDHVICAPSHYLSLKLVAPELFC